MASDDLKSDDLKLELSALRLSVDALSEHISLLAKPQNPEPFVLSDEADGLAYLLETQPVSLRAIANVSAPPLSLLLGIDQAKSTLLQNTKRFAYGHSANNALLWGARGMGKSTLVKSIFLELAEASKLNLIEIHREDILSLPTLMRSLADRHERFLIFCDDLSFNRPDRDFKALKSILEGGLEGRPDNILFYATSNRRHMLPKSNSLDADLMQAQEHTEETVALSDRFGLWLGFHACSQTDYLDMVGAYIRHFGLNIPQDKTNALEWAKTRGNRSGRTAWQYVQNLAGAQSRAIFF